MSLHFLKGFGTISVQSTPVEPSAQAGTMAVSAMPRSALEMTSGTPSFELATTMPS